MEYLPGGLTLEIPRDCFPLSTDSMVLADFITVKNGDRILDLGSGCGTLGLLLCAKSPGCRLSGIELSENAHRAALENIRRNALESRMESIQGSIAALPDSITPGSYSLCVSNPPYFSGGPAAQNHTAARREESCTAADLMKAAAWALKYGGDFYLVHRPERLGELIALAAGEKLEAKRLRLLRHSPSAPINLVLLQFRKGGKPGLKLEELCLHNADGSPSPDSRRIYHTEET